MKAIVTILGVVLLIVAAMYFLVPADSLPTFFPDMRQALCASAPSTVCWPAVSAWSCWRRVGFSVAGDPRKSAAPR